MSNATHHSHYWLMKSEPSTFSIDDLLHAHDQSTLWDGVRNYQARNTLRDAMTPGDLAFFYHSSCSSPGIAGIVTITQTGLPDPSAFDPESEYFDRNSNPSNPRWYAVKVRLIQKLDSVISLSTLRTLTALQHSPLLRKGNRLSVFELSSQEWCAVQSLITQTSGKRQYVIAK